MNIMAGCLSATEGHVRIGGYDILMSGKGKGLSAISEHRRFI